MDIFFDSFNVQRTYTKQTSGALLQGSLNDISSNPVGRDLDSQKDYSTLRRSKSLAIGRADIFSNLDIPNQPRRAQLIPRAKLVDKSTFKERRYQPSNDDIKNLKKRQSLPVTNAISNRTLPLKKAATGIIYKKENKSGSYSKQLSTKNSEIDNENTLNVSLENLNETKLCKKSPNCNVLGLSLPNYYPDNKYDTDVSVTAENISINSDIEYFCGNSQSLPTYAYEYDSSLSDLEPRYYETNTFNPIFTDFNYESVSDSCSELNNFDEITVNNNKNIEETENPNKNIENKDKKIDYEKTLYIDGKVSPTLTIKSDNTIKGSIHEKQNLSDTENLKENSETGEITKEKDDQLSKSSEDNNNEIKTEIYSTIQKPTEDHVTLITIDNSSEENKTKICNTKKNKSPTDIKRQNYLKDLLENNTNTRPIKNFITKNISRAFSEKKSNTKLISTESFVTTLVENQYHSLPDINAGKYLQKCEKIDRKLRKCDKLTRSKSNQLAEYSKNRFVVNIGQHLNIPNKNASIPVDFEVKISKVPKIQKTPVKSNSFAGRNTSKIDINNPENKHFTLQQKSNYANHKSETKVSNFATITKQTKQKLLSSFKKNADAKSLEKSKIKHLPKITEVVEKKDDDISNKKTIRNYSKIEEKPENKYNSCSELDSLEFIPITQEEIRTIAREIINENTDKMEKHIKNKENNNDKQNNSSSPSPVQEYHEKLGTMRCFWDKMINNVDSNKSEDEKEDNECKEITGKTNLHIVNIMQESPPTKQTISKFENMKDSKSDHKKIEPCKIIEMQSKIEDVKKIFESNKKTPPKHSPGLVETNRKKFEPRPSEKSIDKMGIYENPYFEKYNSSPSCTASESSVQYESLNPNIVEIVEKDKEKQKSKEIIENGKNITSNNKFDKTNVKKQVKGDKSKTTTVIKSKSFDQGPEFDHVRYKVMKSDLFQKNIFANYEKESQFDGLMQYLQDYSFQELLIDNNIVIIEPIRTKVEFSDAPKKTKKIAQLLPKPTATETSKENKQSPLRRHFFYHPIRVNREVNDAELPNPDTVKQVRQFFERTGVMKKSQSHNEIDHPPKKKTIRYQTVIDPDRDHCSESDVSSEHEKPVENGLIEENEFESIANDATCCDQQYVSEDVLQKIRECGTCVTYYGGKVLKENNNKHSPLTKAIMEEIKGTQERNEECACRRKESKTITKKRSEKITKNNNEKTTKNLEKQQQENNNSNCKILEDKITFKQTPKTIDQKANKEVYQGIKFKLIKSNSCSSRLELVGTENMSEYRKKFLERQKMIIDEQNLKNKQLNGNHDKIESIKEIKESLINEEEEKQKNKLNLENGETEKNQKIQILEETPKIVAEEKKISGNKMRQQGSINDEKQETQIFKEPNANYIDYKEYEKIRRNTRKFNDMEFETYEVVENK